MRIRQHNTIIQSLVTDDRRARVMSFYTMAFFGAAPFGSLLAGTLAHHIGAPHTVMLTGAFCVAGSLWFTLERPAVNAGMQPARARDCSCDDIPTQTLTQIERKTRDALV